MFKKLISFIDELFINDKEELFSKSKKTILGTHGYITKTGKRSLLIKETETNSEKESENKNECKQN